MVEAFIVTIWRATAGHYGLTKMCEGGDMAIFTIIDSF
jgi:hypothetical protein